MRIGIVNDSVMIREVLRRLVLSVPGQEVAWAASDGNEAVAMARRDRPDVILMDLFMPGMDGVEATRRIMSESPCAILVVTATVSGHIAKVYQAMGYGALDAVDTPVVGMNGEVKGASLLLRKMEVVGKLIDRPQPASAVPQPVAAVARPSWERPPHPLIVIGASTGGPFALGEILSKLPKSLKACIVIIQHVDSAFAQGLGQWLGDHAGRKVEIAAEGDDPTEGRILLSGTDDHLVLGPDRRLHYSAEPTHLSYRPSVDVFFRSVARYWPRPGVAVILTGMGRDGALGLLELRGLGWKTIAQDEQSSVVFGMPKAAVELHAADHVVPLPRIAQAISNLLPTQLADQAQTYPARL